jgi:4,5-DOPA dioxygenase extradiol
MTSVSPAFGMSAAALTAMHTLKKSPRMPVLFLGHGSPMNAIEDNAYRRSWQTLGAEFGGHVGAKYPTPQLIICISAHWLTRGWQFTAMDRPKTIHDFGGFPQALFDQQYPAPGAAAVVREISEAIATPKIALDTHQWGLDHGTWAVIKPMFPSADIPVVQLSMDYDRAAAEHFALGRELAQLRDWGVLIVGSGNIVHNLRAMRLNGPAGQTYEWAKEFDAVIGDHVAQGRLSALRDFQKLGQLAQLAHPTFEHYLPLLYAAGAASAAPATEAPLFFNADFQGASISMRSVIWR